MAGVHFIYKCRACERHFSKGRLPTFEEADRVLSNIRISATNGGPYGEGYRMLGGHHDCTVLTKGIGDLIGIGDDPNPPVTRPR